MIRTLKKFLKGQRGGDSEGERETKREGFYVPIHNVHGHKTQAGRKLKQGDWNSIRLPPGWAGTRSRKLSWLLLLWLQLEWGATSRCGTQVLWHGSCIFMNHEVKHLTSSRTLRSTALSRSLIFDSSKMQYICWMRWKIYILPFSCYFAWKTHFK